MLTRPDAAARQNAVKVLIADDDPIFRSLVCAKLVALRGHGVEAVDGAAAWQLLSKEVFDMAIVDLSMPGLDGFELIQCVRGHPKTRHLPIVVITSNDDRDSIAKALAAGATSFITKPVNWSTFEYHIGFLLRIAETDRVARASNQLARVLARTKETILTNLCAKVADAANVLRDAIEEASRISPAGKDEPTPASHLRIALQETKRLAKLTRAATCLSDMLSHNMIETDDWQPLASILRGCLETLKPIALDAGVQIEALQADGDVHIRCDANSIELAMLQLVNNAITYSPRGGKVSITSRVYPDGLLAIDVTDCGAGMHPNLVSSIFMPLHECQLQDNREGDIGVGLQVAKAVAEAHGGTLELRSLPGQGTTVLLILPPDRVIQFAQAAA